MRSIACWMDCAARMRQRCEASLLWWQTGQEEPDESPPVHPLPDATAAGRPSAATAGDNLRRRNTYPLGQKWGAGGPTRILTVWTATRSGSPAFLPWPLL